MTHREKWSTSRSSSRSPIVAYAVLWPVLLLALACASGGGGADIPEPEIGIRQVTASTFILERGGRLSIEYRILVQNRASVPITLKRFELQTHVQAPYELSPQPKILNVTIGAGETKEIPITIWAWSRGVGASGPREPVTLRGTARFATPDGGGFQVPFVRRISQPETSG